MTGATVKIYQQKCNGAACGASSIDLLAHGYGHALGLDDVLTTNCDGTIMGRPLAGHSSTVPPEVCGMLESRWPTNDPYACPSYVPPRECDCYNAGMWPDYCSTPIVVDYSGGGFDFTGRHDQGVWFDFSATGSPDPYTWIAPRTRQAFLCRDLSQNGTIDSGRELFGNDTVLLNGSLARLGYEALAELDSEASGGNGDGVIDRSDAGYDEIQVWFDRNGNGETEPGELVPLSDAGIVALGTEYTLSDQQDPQGNLLPYWSDAWVRDDRGDLRRVDTVDVIFIRLSH